ncbi:MAG: molybdopterin-dependent oxidoreductase [Xanthobacteraceae bacterium]|nr:molybdopterin-dependent oxidoreductase [Xanthobacteraceae bacterium]
MRVVTGDTDNTPYGGGTWASRAAGIGGEAAWQAGKALRANVLAVAGSILQAAPESPRYPQRHRDRPGDRARAHRSRRGGARRLFPPRLTLPPGFQAELMATRPPTCRAPGPSPSPTASRRAFSRWTSGPASSRCWKHWCVEDCGTVINPQLVDEQVRLAASCRGSARCCSSTASTTSADSCSIGNMADYLVPMAYEMPDIAVGHVVSPTADSGLGARGGEAGTAGAPACVMNAVNDALSAARRGDDHRDADHPSVVLRALGRV